MCEIGEMIDGMDGMDGSLAGLFFDGATRKPKLQGPTMTSMSRTSHDYANCNRRVSSSHGFVLWGAHHLIYHKRAIHKPI
jgi:hypothetical protein